MKTVTKVNQLIKFASYDITTSSRQQNKKKLKEWITRDLIVSIRNINKLSNKLH